MASALEEEFCSLLLASQLKVLHFRSWVLQMQDHLSVLLFKGVLALVLDLEEGPSNTLQLTFFSVGSLCLRGSDPKR